MIIDDKRTPTTVSGNITESFFSVKQENLAHIFSILRNQLYSDKISAVIREYSTNAFDAHVDAGISDKPISITVPTRWYPSLHIRDYGKGLSEDEIFTVFSSYGESTKRNTNDQVGMMGLGSKSAFAYAETFTIVSYNGGFKKTYMAYIDDSGIGKITKVCEEPSDETGVEIQLAVDYSDVFRFENAIAKQLKFFNPKPNVDNTHIKSQWNQTLSTVVSKPDYRIVNNSEHLVIMGNVAYPFTHDSVKKPEIQKELEALLRYSSTGVHLFANIGDVVPSASRESLDMREKTTKWIQDKIVQIYNNLKDDVTTELNKCKSMWDVRVKYNSMNSAYQTLVKDYTRDGLDIDNGYAFVKGYNCHLYGNLDKFVKIEQLRCVSETKIFVNKGDISLASMKKRIKHNYGSGNVYAFHFETYKQYTEFLENDNFKGANIIDASTLSLPETEKQTKTHDAYFFTGYDKNWAKVNVNFKLDKCVYVGIDHYEPKNFDNYNIKRIKEILSSFGHDIDIYGVTESNIGRLGEGWVYIRDYVQGVIDNLPQSTKENISLGHISRTTDRDTINLYYEFAHLEDDPFNFKSIIDIDFRTVNTDNAYRIHSLNSCGFKYDFTKENEIVKQLSDIKGKYPMVKHVIVSERTLPDIKEYIKVMNK